MKKYHSSSFVKLSPEDVLDKLQSAPVLMDVSGECGVMHYHPAGGVLSLGSIMRYHLIYGFQRFSWTARIVSGHLPDYYVTEMVEGPFKHWKAWHSLEEQGGGCVIRDSFEYEASETLESVLADMEIRYSAEEAAAASQKEITTKFRVLGQDTA
jgi:ligand-binding SRPBCC domain-containing protein